jgi:hypothetical protein
MAMGLLRKKHVVVDEADQSGSRAKVARLTPRGQEAQDACRQLLATIEERWQARFGKGTIRTLRESLERLVGDPSARLSPLFRGLSLTPTGGERRSASPTRCHITPWCCTAADSLMAVDPHQRGRSLQLSRPPTQKNSLNRILVFPEESEAGP